MAAAARVLNKVYSPNRSTHGRSRAAPSPRNDAAVKAEFTPDSPLTDFAGHFAISTGLFASNQYSESFVGFSKHSGGEGPSPKITPVR